MATIHINTDLLRQLGQQFIQLNEQIQNVTAQLENDWQGQNRSRFDQMYNDWRSSTARIVQVGEDLGRHLQHTAQQFEQADSSW